MKSKYLVFLLGLSVLTSACADSDISIGAAGKVISTEQLFIQHATFNQELTAHPINATDIEQVNSIHQKVTVVALFGTWCHDSEREVPRLIKLLNQADNPNISLKLIAVNTQKEAPEHYQLKYTPTFIIYDENQQELGRIIERPKESLSQDLSAIVNNA